VTSTLLERDPAGPEEAPDLPRSIDPGLPPSDVAFRNIARLIGLFVLVLTGSIGLFLGYQAIPTLNRYGFSFFTQTQFQPARNLVGISAVLVGTVEVAVVALVVGFPLALLTALYISEYAPSRFKSTFIAFVDLMAAVPSIIYGLWGADLLQSKSVYIARWLSQHFGWIPFFKANQDPNAASGTLAGYTGSAFIAGLCVAMMVIPLSCSVMRGVFSLAPIGEREAAYALGSTRWGMIRTVVLPFGRGAGAGRDDRSSVDHHTGLHHQTGHPDHRYQHHLGPDRDPLQ
jgi:phosphate transport system permease protein